MEELKIIVIIMMKIKIIMQEVSECLHIMVEIKNLK